MVVVLAEIVVILNVTKGYMLFTSEILENLQMKIQKLDKAAVLPSRAKIGDAGYDIVALDDGVWSDDMTYIQYRTGIAIELPEGYHAEVFPRSSISKTDLLLANSIGLIDNGYRGEVLCRFKYVVSINKSIEEGRVSPHIAPTPKLYKKGDKIAQIVIRKTESLQVVEVKTLSSTERGSGGFGSSGA